MSAGPTTSTGNSTTAATTGPSTSNTDSGSSSSSAKVTSSPSPPASPPPTTSHPATSPPPPPASDPPASTKSASNSGSGNVSGSKSGSVSLTGSAGGKSSVPLITTGIPTTSVGTLSNGEKFTTVFDITSVIPDPTPGLATQVTSGKANHVGLIVGAVIGGIAFIAISGLVLSFVVSRARKARQERAFDGDFDPDKFMQSREPTLPVVAAVGNGSTGRSGGGGSGYLNGGPNSAAHGSGDGGYSAYSDVPSDDGMGGRLMGVGMGMGAMEATPFLLSQHVQSQPAVHPQHQEEDLTHDGIIDRELATRARSVSPPLSHAHSIGSLPQSIPPQGGYHYQKASSAAGHGHTTSAGSIKHYQPTASFGVGSIVPMNHSIIPSPLPTPGREALESQYPQYAQAQGPGGRSTSPPIASPRSLDSHHSHTAQFVSVQPGGYVNPLGIQPGMTMESPTAGYDPYYSAAGGGGGSPKDSPPQAFTFPQSLSNHQQQVTKRPSAEGFGRKISHAPKNSIGSYSISAVSQGGASGNSRSGTPVMPLGSDEGHSEGHSSVAFAPNPRSFSTERVGAAVAAGLDDEERIFFRPPAQQQGSQQQQPRYTSPVRQLPQQPTTANSSPRQPLSQNSLTIANRSLNRSNSFGSANIPQGFLSRTRKPGSTISNTDSGVGVLAREPQPPQFIPQSGRISESPGPTFDPTYASSDGGEEESQVGAMAI